MIPEYNSVSQSETEKFFFCWCQKQFLYVMCWKIAYRCNFSNCYLAAPWPTLGHFRGASLTHPILITAFLHFRPEGHQEPRNPVEQLVRFELGTFWFLLQRLNPLGHSPQKFMSHAQNVKFYKLPYLIIFTTSMFTNTIQVS